MHQTRVSDLGVVEVERLQSGKAREVRQAHVCDCGVPEFELCYVELKVCHGFGQPGEVAIGNGGHYPLLQEN
jgi:hypothetical protein